MKTKAAFKYQLSDARKSLVIYYVIIYTLLVIMAISDIAIKNQDVNGTIRGIESASIMFIFVAGLNSFKNTFHFFLVNSLSRLTLFKTFTLGIFSIGGFMALVDTINGYIFSSFTRYRSLFYQLYSKRYEVYGGLAQLHGRLSYHGESFLWSLFIYTLAGIIGYFVTVSFYRMNKFQKIIVSVGLPILFLIVIPFLDYRFFNRSISNGIIKFLTVAFGFSNSFNPNPYISMLTSAIGFAVFAGLSYLLIRKATIKE